MKKLLHYLVICLISVHGIAQQNVRTVSGVATSESEAILKKKEAPADYLGSWRGEFQIRPDVTVPFNFELKENGIGSSRIYFINGDERFDGGSAEQRADSVLIYFDAFDNQFSFKQEGETLTGILTKQGGSGVGIPVRAERSKNYRFVETKTPAAGNISGTYDVTFISTDGREEKAVGMFEQEGKKLRGTFLKVTGDSRYLEGIVEGNKFFLSSFIGSAPSYYEGTFGNDGRLKGEIVGARGGTAFFATANEKAALPDPYSLTYLKNGYKSLDFSFPDVTGRKVSLKDKKYQNKVVILTIGGTWCPNCIDEAGFLAPWYKKNKNRGVEIISLHYERQTDSAFVAKALTRFREKFGIEYDQLVGGKADKQAVAASLPALNTFLSFPTTIFIDRQGNVAKIHTGYTGPATGKFYTAFVEEFNRDIDELLK